MRALRLFDYFLYLIQKELERREQSLNVRTLLIKLKTTKRSASFAGPAKKRVRSDRGERNRTGERVNPELSLCAARAALSLVSLGSCVSRNRDERSTV